MHYHFWSKGLNVHFGYYTWGKSLRLESMLRAMNDLVAQSLYLTSFPAKILDLGCGFGSTAIHIAQFFPLANLIGINILEEQVSIAQKRGERHNVNFITANFEKIPFEPSSFDAAYALESACYTLGDNKSNFIREASRVLRPDSPFVIVDGFRKHSAKLPWLVEILYKKNLEAWGIPSLAPIEHFCKKLKEFGFEEVRTREISWNMLPSLMWIPIVVLRLYFSSLSKKDVQKNWYIRALLLTLAFAHFKGHFGYYLVTCVKSNVELKK